MAAPAGEHTGPSAVEYTVVIPTVMRTSLDELLRSIDGADGPAPEEIIVVVDGPYPGEPGYTPQCAPLTLARSGGRGPAAARNIGWRKAATPWVVFLDDDVRVTGGWCSALHSDLAEAGAAGAAGTQARIVVPRPAGRKPTDAERGTIGLETARWITADMAYRTDVLAAVDGFDEAFPRAYREDADVGLRISRTHRIIAGRRRTVHPVQPAGPLASVRAQRGNRDDAVMRRKHGRHWRAAIGEGPGLMHRHLAAVVLGGAGLLTASSRTPRAAAAAGAGWLAITAWFAAQRMALGPPSIREWTRMAVTSALIPPAAVAHRLAGEYGARTRGPDRRRNRVSAVLFDRDDTLIVDVPYLGDPDGVRPASGVYEALAALRADSVLLGVVSNQSGVGRGMITRAQAEAVNRRVDELLGPFDTWQICYHRPDSECGCRKPRPGLVRQAARELGVPVDSCVMIGDILDDVRAAEAAGARGILVPTPRTRPVEARQVATADLARSLVDAAAQAMRRPRAAQPGVA
ncbi:HAD-IIIA family hydrolase [Tomitella gaofuii]|uniref:HAD-IIIA family hydrolase n=1 Tax=Tomitella gaofuii TaxID=2760083 RepID=UPI0015F7E3A4|nr:HAD-IIIA family hydrolase [Tomitella gaofuii]